MQFLLNLVTTDSFINLSTLLNSNVFNINLLVLDTLPIQNSLKFVNDNINSFTLVESVLNDDIFSQYIINLSDLNFLDDLANYCNDVSTSQPKVSFIKSQFLDMAPEFKKLETVIRRYHLRFPHLTREEIWDIMSIGGSELLQMELIMSDDRENTPINYTNLYNYKGNVIDVTTLSDSAISNLMSEVDDIHVFESMEHIRTNYTISTPNVKLYYPEAFIASPSFIHNDLGFLHILQYQYWLWFFFIFLIVFYFVSFVCVVRWCNNRTQPRRETRGVSRSKCGDLITATVPVTWALSIIVSETTDATDYYDGFGTGELIVGIRAYQWGWEYYYPKNVDLNYNLKPSYSTFIGNSLKYNTSTEKTLESRDIWRFYQNKVNDSIISPAHFLVIPFDNSKLFNFMDFNDLGVDNLKESDAFKKIRLHSKVYTTNLVHTPSIFVNKYNKLSTFFINENNLTNSLNYGNRKQHNLTSNAALSSINSVLLDSNSIEKLLMSNLQLKKNNSKTYLFNDTLDTWTKVNSQDSLLSSINSLNTLFSKSNTYNSNFFQLLISYPNLLKEFGDNTDKASVKYPLNKLFNTKLFNKNLINNNNLTNALSNEFTFSNSTNFIKTNLDNNASTSKEFFLNSVNKNLTGEQQSVRFYKNFNLKNSNINLSNGLNSLDSNLTKFNSYSSTNDLLSYNLLSKLNWTDLNSFNKIASNKLYLLSPFSPIINNDPNTSRIDYDRTSNNIITTNFNQNNVTKKTSIYKGPKTTDDGAKSLLLVGKLEGSLPTLRSAYWQMFWSNTNPSLRLNNTISTLANQEIFYLPIFTTYRDYDFRNAQALEMLEEIFWETSFSSYNYLDYLNIADIQKQSTKVFSNEIDFENKFDIQDYVNDKNIIPSVTFFKDYSSFGKIYSNYIQSDDFITKPNLLNLKNFDLITFSDSINALDDSYLSFKQLSNLFNNYSFTSLNTNSTFNYPQSYISVLNNFRGDFIDFSWYVDNLFSRNNNLENQNFSLTDYSNDSQSLLSNTTRFTNPITLRSTARNSIVTYGALQKVFRSVLEENRSNLRLTTFSNLGINQPFISGDRVPFEKLLGKNKENFYNTNFYFNKKFNVFNDLASTNHLLNIYFFDFPFLLSLTSSVSRYMWFDWYSKWSMLDVQAAPGSKYSIVGVPFFKKHFDFTTDKNDSLSDTENYFNRLAYARKNYLPTWVYTPYMYTRSRIWLPNTEFTLFNIKDLLNLKTLFKSMSWYWETLGFVKNNSEYFTPTFSNLHKNTWRPYKSIQAYYYNISVLTDLLTHREFLYRQYFENNNKVIQLPRTLIANPKNPLLNELKSSFLLIDPITYNAEYSREFYINKTSYFNYILFKNWINKANISLIKSPINTNLVNDYLFFYFLDNNSTTKLGNNVNLYKSQYKPLKRGISNLLRLHGTGAVALPIEIRLQILASSRDVIHSWAIPSAGVKIDCIPGYTSHRIMTFFTPGIYWGQCMEICGRFHHWMPIIVYFMKRDLFFLWCTHFISENYTNSTLDINEKQFNDYIRLASYDKTTWLTEVSKYF